MSNSSASISRRAVHSLVGVAIMFFVSLPSTSSSGSHSCRYGDYRGVYRNLISVDDGGSGLVKPFKYLYDRGVQLWAYEPGAVRCLWESGSDSDAVFDDCHEFDGLQ